MLTLASALQPENALLPMEVTPEGTVTLVSPVQPKNAPPPIVTMLEGMAMAMAMAIRLVQPENAMWPMPMTLGGMVTLVSLAQREKASRSMAMTLEGTVYGPTFPSGQLMRTFCVALKSTPPKLTYCGFPAATMMDWRPVQITNGLSPMLVTLEGIW